MFAGILTISLYRIKSVQLSFSSYRGMARESGEMQRILISPSTIPTESTCQMKPCSI